MNDTTIARQASAGSFDQLKSAMSYERAAMLDFLIAEMHRVIAEREAPETIDLQTQLSTLETEYRRTVTSTSWKITWPMRLLIAKLRGYELPAWPGSYGDEPAPEELPEPNEVTALFQEMRTAFYSRKYKDLFKLRDKVLANTSASPVTALAADYCVLLFRNKFSAFEHAEASADAVLNALVSGDPQDLKQLSDADIERLAREASRTLTRIGRREDAERLLDRMAELRDMSADLLSHRGMALWPYDHAKALGFLEKAAEMAPPKKSALLLRAHLETVLAIQDKRPFKFPVMSITETETLLSVAHALFLDRDFENYKKCVNAFFELDRLSGPIRPEATEFRFDDLATAPKPTDGPLVTVIMTTHNSVDTLDYAIRSITDQTHANIELIIVDDCSTDDTRDRLLGWQQDDPRISLIFNTKNVGTYASKNRAMEIAKGEYLTFHDSDDWSHPQRIARHVECMEENPDLAASRSAWIRLSEDGELVLRRWHGKYPHANPASLFLRRSVIEKIGYFDNVRYGADSEYMHRVMRVFGASGIEFMTSVLAFGLHHKASLTRSGGGSMGLENFAPTRGAYAAGYSDWYVTSATDDVFLPIRPDARGFPAPEEMCVPLDDLHQELDFRPGKARGKEIETAPDVPILMFGISLASRATSKDWSRTQQLLSATLRSLLNQSDPRFTVAICGHDLPDVPELKDDRVTFFRTDVPPPDDPTGFRRDKMRKRRILGRELARLGGGYFFFLDADDLIHRDFVKHVLETDNRRGYTIEKGYAYDFNGKTLAPVPGTWSVGYDRVCGSSAAVYFYPHELPVSSELDEDLLFNKFREHANWPVLADEIGRSLDKVPFPAGVYVVNHGQSISFSLQRKGSRSAMVVSRIAENAIADGKTILHDEFGF